MLYTILYTVHTTLLTVFYTLGQLAFTPFDPRTKKTEGKLQGPDGGIFYIAKVCSKGFRSRDYGADGLMVGPGDQRIGATE
jgi:hypothetical protein